MTNSDALAVNSSRKILRRIGAVLGGMIVVVILDLTMDVIMHATGIFPPWGQPMSSSLFLIATTYRAIDGTIGAYVAARLAPDRPFAHALAVGIIGFLLASVGAIVTWNMGLGPRWYPIALIGISLPCACLGGWLRLRQLKARH